MEKEKTKGELQEENEVLRRENEKLRGILEEKFPAQTLFFWSSLTALALIFDLAAYFQYGVCIIHPALAIPLLIAGAGFALIAIFVRDWQPWKRNHNQEKKIQ